MKKIRQKILIYTAFFVAISQFAQAMEQKPPTLAFDIKDIKAGNKSACEFLTKRTGVKHLYAEAKLISIMEAPALTYPDFSPQEDKKVALKTQPLSEKFKGYFVRFASSDLDFENSIIRGTDKRFEELKLNFEKGHSYSFCYTVESKKRIAINYPETIRLLDKGAQ